MFEVEETLWWYRGLRRIVFLFLRPYLRSGQKLRILDAGCGTGILLTHLSSLGQTWGFDYAEEALSFCRQRGLKNIRQASITAIPFAAESFDLVTCLDVLSCQAVEDDELALREIYRVLRRGGLAIINLAAHRFLYSSHDRATRTARRYSRREVQQKAKRAGFSVLRLSYWNFFPFPAVAVTRLLRKGATERTTSDLRLPHPLLNSFLDRIVALEALLLRYIDLPLGSSIIGVLRKED
ncbi:hypothetical protein HKBW3S06_00335 [Candidatus Hakubella thermalkaliphila]|uniref:Methyltransferase type 11 domain-containing protein n=2 Tax=Candidatus Hakubella thermalkaliphila TaxID=2754717 RepID=A0A6V8NL80_9ACTN|nr:hypothetical protein HKBW3S06_00335 [Candidatus Hakubella thermalkaliphila]